ncbi:MAG TPA: FapA family protein [Spirochaetota bacterium]|nr:FapA family protein [Spirochaetota bacterium]
MKLALCYFDTAVSRMFVEKTDEKGEKAVTLSSPHNFVYRDEIVAKVVSVEDPADAELEIDKGYSFHVIEKNPSFKPGEGIYQDQFSSTYKASEYGFVILDRNTQRLRLITPIQISKDKVRAYFVIFPTKFMKVPAYVDIEKALQQRKILAILDKESIEEQLSKIDLAQPVVNRVLVARGKEPVTGYDEYFIPLIKLEKKVGKVLEDGRMDFKEVDSIIEIRRGQEVLKKIPGVKSEDGMDIYGEKVDAAFEAKDGFSRGGHVVESMGDGSVFVSDIDGCLSLEGKKISVSPFAIIKGNVDYDSGNIDFNGSVHVLGSVLPGFSVKARGDIIVDKNVDDAYLEADGDVTVKHGISGKGTMKIIAGGRVRSKYILNSTVEAVKDIEVEDSIINSKVFSNDRISVTARNGKIIGGEIIARHEIVVNVAGVSRENITKLTVGESLFVERELIEIRREADSVKTVVQEIMRKIKASFGEGLFEDPKKFLAILPPVKKKNCLLMLQELTAHNRELGEINKKRIEVEAKLKLERDPVVIVTEEVFPGTVISIKKRKRRIEEKLVNVKFYEDPSDKEIRYTAAV